jgi:hypothetical protein
MGDHETEDVRPLRRRSGRAVSGSGLRRLAPLIVAAVLLWGPVAAMVALALARTGGRLVYPLDDAYIHMAMAKHLARDGVYGVTPFAFSSSSSSPLWTLLLALLDRIIGVRDATPLVLTLLFATGALVVAHRALEQRLSPVRSFVALAALVILVPLPVVVLSGMEHALQILLVLAFAHGVTERITSARPDGALSAPGLLALAAALPVTRYEGLFVIAVFGGMLAARGRVRLAAAIVLAALVPVAIYATVSVAHGWLPLPNSVLLKGAASPRDLLLAIPRQLGQASALAATIGVALAARVAIRGRGDRGSVADRSRLTGFLLVAALHLQLARVGWLHRYEAYLIALGVVAVAPVLLGGAPVADAVARPGAARAWRTLRMAALILALGLAWRRIGSLEQAVIATQNIHDQQVQMGRFLAAAYDRRGVAANDIGAINYFADVRCCDLIGLADMETARLHRPGRPPTSDAIARVVAARGASIAVIYETWFSNGDVAVGGVPREWGDAVGRWVIRDNVICAGDTVAFYAVDPGEREALAAKLSRFAASLPDRVGRR